jgi:hypothetical protein
MSATVKSERLYVHPDQYDISVYDMGGSFMGAVHCRHCGTRHETDDLADAESAAQAVEALARTHHDKFHRQ